MDQPNPNCTELPPEDWRNTVSRSWIQTCGARGMADGATLGGEPGRHVLDAHLLPVRGSRATDQEWEAYRAAFLRMVRLDERTAHLGGLWGH